MLREFRLIIKIKENYKRKKNLFKILSTRYDNVNHKRAGHFFTLYTFIALFSQLLYKKKLYQFPTRINCNLLFKLSKKTSNSVFVRLYNSTTSLVQYCLLESIVVLYVQIL